MLSKILAVVVAAVVLSVGGYAYWDYARSGQAADHSNVCSTEPTSAPSSCCQQLSRASTEISCCTVAGDEGPVEVLSIQPREVVE